jgi:hypothetical protein
MNRVGSLQQVVVVPWNGYVNRLQAWASASILAQRLGAELRVAWEAEPVAPASASTLFSPSLISESFVSLDYVSDLLGHPHSEMPRYLTINKGHGVAFLAGHDRGEQYFMEDLLHKLQTQPAIAALVIVAGGKFHLPYEKEFMSKRRTFYQQVSWHSEIQDQCLNTRLPGAEYLGLHIRETDRSREAPTQRSLTRAVRHLAEALKIENILVTADTDSARSRWFDELDCLGLSPWVSAAKNFNRGESQSARDAIADWLLLGRSEAIIYSAQSSFGQEAAIMTTYPEHCRGLEAPRATQRFRDVNRISISAMRAISGGRSTQ